MREAAWNYFRRCNSSRLDNQLNRELTVVSSKVLKDFRIPQFHWDGVVSTEYLERFIV